MIALLLVSLAFTFIAVFLWRQNERESRRFWQHIEVLEGDKRALTESLCRAQGRPYFPPRERVTIPSDGWWDAAEQVKSK